ncbi:MAG: D-alanyl-D-alanine carboxypeptidase (penicillin-binding protein 5/6) [Candidatus Peregrinibacteria bacterium Greene0416_19]|nr:MAG: D-alanyl-D-alanine carboxypeptidase (penicillin-binding protein 5/6) [Candidatus Peregrinibacteria bacterium Greene0416_19]
MITSILSVLLLGMLPMIGNASPGRIMIARLPIASPSPLVATLPQFHTLSDALTASGVLIMDLQSGQQMYARDADTRRPVASLTKLMTALVIAESHDLREWVPVPADIGRVGGHVAYLPPGEHFTVGDLLKALLIGSANDAADTLASFHSGSSLAFAEEMNQRARELGLRNTSFRNPAGLDDDEQWSTARDIGWLVSYVVRRPELRTRLSTLSAVIVSREGNELTLSQTHALLRGDNPIIAGKTGTTDLAGECLMSIVREGSRDYVVVLLGSRERYEDMRVVLRILAALVA